MSNFVNSMYTPSLTYTYNGELNLDLIKPINVELPALGDLFTIIQGVRCGEYLHYVNPLTTVLTKAAADCNPTYVQAGSITDRQLTTGNFATYLEWCEAEFTAICTALVQKYIKPGLDGLELEGALMNVIFEQVKQTMAKDILKVMFFGQSNYLGSSVYSAIDGVFTKFYDSEAAYCVQPVSNSLPNTATSVLSANQARDTFRLLWGNSNIRLKQLPNNAKVFWVTGSVWENYYDSLIDNCCVEGSWKMGQDGVNELYYRGIKVMPLWFADEALSSETGNPYYNTLRHFIVYTAKANHYMGVERSSDLNNLTSCFDCRTNSNLIKAKMRFGYNFVQCDLISWAK